MLKDISQKLRSMYQPTDLNMQKEPRQLLESWLNKSVRIEVSDGRVFFGDFMCTDHEGSAILANTTEWNQGRNRNVSMVVIPGKHIKKFSVHA
ncbi:Sm domain-containing protein [Schizosaccharomyces japonicus yFS275]|uniref:Sm domain-containing protein n=1 Tax=Schizosaccharomyces japonicus (strain yFS275 / FY16936) TaxID=402676 RepID=T0RSR7_SCHJY|nr:Sm domain-containing protein [Schizosaccharomyces japonicus yFS275]EQC52970.1 Sm domain-containing protein [Schizosaccharomyces japonicus yFS275]